MTRPATLLLVVALVLGSVSAVPMAAAAQANDPVSNVVGQSGLAQADANASENASVSPGERLSAVVGVGQAEFEGELELRTYGIEYALAASNDSKAEVVKDRLQTVQERLQELERQRERLREARENGTMGEGEYQARVTELAARSETLRQVANASQTRAEALPADVLEANGVNVSAIRDLQRSAANLTGPEVAAIAQSIAGPEVGQAISRGPPADIGGPPDNASDRGGAGDRAGDGDRGDADAGAAIDRAVQQVDAAEARLEQAEDQVGPDASENATEALEQARAELERARQALEDARAAADAGDHEEAATLAEEALRHAEQAEAHAQDALDAATQSGGGDGTTPTVTPGDDGPDGTTPTGTPGGAGGQSG